MLPMNAEIKDYNPESELDEWQNPKGCRYVTGEPGHGPWWYCQKPIVEGNSPGNALKPPYCAEHFAPCCAQTSHAFSITDATLDKLDGNVRRVALVELLF